MTIGEISRATGVPRSAIRYYEAAGIIAPPPRRNGRRQYEPAVVDELKALRFYRASGIPIRGLASIARHAPGSKARRDVWVDVLEARIADLDVWMSEAERVRGMLEAAVECRCKGERDKCAVFAAADSMASA